ncbi:MAG: type I DNA topoisomerase [Bacilli bacterium]
MTDKLVIVESPSKSRTIEKYLGKGYKVVSSKGHIRDLATTGKFGLGVDVDADFTPNYIPITGKSKLIKELKKAVMESDIIYLATDPDREGEAISWHLKDALDIDSDRYERVLFHEITKDKVIDAFNHTRKIDIDLVHGQETRRILDRIIGFRLSKLMQQKTGGKSAGRVQSVALKLIVDREREILAFKKEEYWTISALFKDFESELFEYKNKKIDIKTEAEAKTILDKLAPDFMVTDVKTTLKARKAKAPFITSTLQQEASTKLGFPAKKTMNIAQKLYEGIDLGTETVGLITYMRTDSIRLSDEFIGSSFHYIEENFGKNYIGYAKKSTKSENVQDAHEAVRPTSVLRSPEQIKTYLSADEYKLYSLIYARSLASLMKDASFNQTTVVLNNNDYHFKATGQVLVFDGYLKVYSAYEQGEDKLLPILKVNEVLTSSKIEPNQHFTQPPARYTEAKLIKEMEELGIGRPSTYATIIDTIKERNYVMIEEKKFAPTEIGIETTDKLQECFSHIINVEYTAAMENDLDLIAAGEKDSLTVLKNFYLEFEPMVEQAFDSMDKKPLVETGELCPECGSPMVIRKGRYGEFTACSNYPKCKYIKKEEQEVAEVMDCPKCKGKIVLKHTRKGKIFYGCNNYPKCKTAFWDLPTGELCPECKQPLVEKNKVIKCSACNYQK